MDSNSFHTAPLSKRTNSIIYSNANGLQKPPNMVKRLECTLEELCFGCIKKVNIKGDVLTGEGKEQKSPLRVWETRHQASDITFVIDEKLHPVYKRKGDDLEVTIELPLVDALTGCTLTLPYLDGEESCLTIDDIITPGSEKPFQDKA
ncbi:hypothetical protein L1987_80637 [Smallanthus sonchifolius]|uniref:Uncharacterized protein n=1 Tax=Smallanthus sonchifolius TaxID=185202 RepID=A0ACB8YMJ9_9ASTR|nr:hypothetical protein L1987_80637 [Smallanthus sonchifolius]